MSGPSLVLTPPTPNQPSPYSSRGTTPDLTSDQEVRSSSETTTIDTIYSLYGEDMPVDTGGGTVERSSWLSSEDANHFKDVVGLSRPIDSPNSFFLSSRASASDLAYLSRDTLPNGKTIDLTEPLDNRDFVAATTSNGQPTQTRRAPHHYSDTVASTFSQSSNETSFSDPGTSRNARPPRSTRPPSTYRGSEHAANGESSASGAASLSPPMSNGPSRTLSNSKSLPIMRVDGWTQPSVHPINEAATSLPPGSPEEPRRSYMVPPVPKLKNYLSPRMGSPMSKTSLVPSEGEEPDAFHVRCTYAQLDVYGVKGDGYEEGIERTRAKLGDSPESQMTADSALCDGTEKVQELSPKELETLASLDR
jgi:USP6 N-terminal-like protein